MYVMVEVPILAGCTYGSKPQGYGNTDVHPEYFRGRMVIFCDDFQSGYQQFHIPIESRYRGSAILSIRPGFSSVIPFLLCPHRYEADVYEVAKEYAGKILLGMYSASQHLCEFITL